MPKTKKPASDSSDSDDGPVDRNPPPPKKAKDSKGSSTSGARTEDKEPTWVLQGTKLVKVRDWKGKVYVDIREFYEKNGQMLPGKKGISLPVDLWRKLISISGEIDEVIASS